MPVVVRGVQAVARAAIRKRVWLIVATGGWWRKGEIESELPTELRRDMRHVISNMTRDGLLAKRPIEFSGGPSERMEYSVTADCLVPYGLTAGDMSAALLGKKIEAQVQERGAHPIGQTFGRLTVLSTTKWRYSHQYYMCRCECGGTREARLTDLKRGVTVSCGCWKTLPRKKRTV